MATIPIANPIGVCAVIVLACACGAPAPSDDPAMDARADRAADSAAVEAAVRSHWAAIKSNDTATVNAQHAANVSVITTVVASRFHVPSPTADSIASTMENATFDFEVEDLELEIAEGVAVATFSLNGGIQYPDGRRDARRRRVTEVWTRQPDGTWKETHHHDSVFQPAAGQPRWSARGVFAVVDLAGTGLLALADVQPSFRPNTDSTWTHALCPNARPLEIAFDSISTTTDRGRAGIGDLDVAPGARYHFVTGKAAAGASCFLTDSTITTVAVPTLARDTAECSPAMTDELATRHGRDVVNCGVRGRWGYGRVSAAQFAWQGNSGLAAVVLRVGGTHVSWLLPAGRTRDGDAWRIEDGGIFVPRYIEPYFVVLAGSTSYLGLGWAGAEGWALQLLRAVGDTLTVIRSGYRYAGG